jgi:hypothetical protein
MRRTIAAFLCLLVLAAAGGTAAAQGAGTEMVRGAGAYWWQHGASEGTLYLIDVYESVGTFDNDPHGYRAFFGAIPCEVGRRNRPVECKFRRADYQRVKVDSFEIDPLLNSAHVVVHKNGRRGEVTWTGRGDYSEPFIWQSAGDMFAPPYFMHAYAHVMAHTGRDAKATGDLFGLGLTRGQFVDAGMADIVYASAAACLSGPWCWLSAEG